MDFLQGTVPLRHLLNEETLLMSLQRSSFNEVNDWALSRTFHKTEVRKIKIEASCPCIQDSFSDASQDTMLVKEVNDCALNNGRIMLC